MRARRGGAPVGAVYRRTRRDDAGKRVQRAEARFDGLAGCLRTPAGGSSRQTLLFVEGDEIASRLISAARGGAADGPARHLSPARGANDAYHLLGDGVVAPVVRRLAERICLRRILFARRDAAPMRRRA